MATFTLPVLGNSQATINADTNPNPSTAVLRDAQGNVQGANVQGSSLQTTGTFNGTPSTQTSSFTAGLATDYLVDCTSSAVTVTFPAASSCAGRVYNIVKKDSTTNAVTLSGVSGTTSLPSQWSKARVFSDGTNWYAV